MRHGTRYPTIKYLKRWQQLEDQLPDRLNSFLSDTAKSLKEWSNPLGRGAERSALAEVGRREQYCLAGRLRKRFPEIVQKVYSPHTVTFRSTEVSRAEQR